MIISLVGLLQDVAEHASVLSRTRTRGIYKKAMKALPEQIYIGDADQAFDLSTRTTNQNVIPVSRIRKDIQTLQTAAKRIKRVVDKVYAHTERDRRRIGGPVRSTEIDAAIKALLEIHHRYTLLILGQDVRELVPEDFFEITEDLRRVWPERMPVENEADTATE